MTSNEIRKKFLEFFAARGHRIFSSDSLVPRNDPSVLFTSAGMNQFKEQFLGNLSDFSRAASCQKCLRTGDLVNVGRTAGHHTFFEMLGNFSFGDYFKEDAIVWAWEFITAELGLPANRLKVSVHVNDEEAFNIWRQRVGIPEDRICRLGDKDNFWPANAPEAGPNGPCGPCSEIFYDWGEGKGCGRADCSPACDCDRFLEIWNLVFTQYDRQPNGGLKPLPQRNIDTGMGLERVARVMQQVTTNYETDLFSPLLKALKQELSREGLTAADTWMSGPAKAIADHIRAAAFAILDGAVPSNEERGYVIRKLIRRSIIYAKQAGITAPFCYRLIYPISEIMNEPYPDLRRRHEHIAGIIKKEEEAFWSVLRERAPQAEAAFSDLAEKLQQTDEPTRLKESARLAFVQYDTFGIPLEVSRDISGRYGLRIDDEDFEREMDRQRERSRAATNLTKEIFSQGISRFLQGVSSEFIGYDSLEAQTVVKAIFVRGNPVDSVSAADEDVDIVLETTPFYAESGGQTGDRGILSNASAVAKVLNTLKADNAILHQVRIDSGTISKGDRLTASVNVSLRLAAARNHTATHILQFALRTVLGEHIEQSGSFVGPEKLRFDFPHLTALDGKTLRELESMINRYVQEDLPVSVAVMDRAQAVEQGALAFFQEKYGEKVRVVSVGDISRELCGGTHVRATGQIGMFKITAESSAAQGIRRIEAVTGQRALVLMQDREALLDRLGGILRSPPEQLPAAAESLMRQLKELEREKQNLQSRVLSGRTDDLFSQTEMIQEVNVLTAELPDYSMDSLRRTWDEVKTRLNPVICVLGATGGKKPLLLVGVSSSLAETGLDAVKIIRAVAVTAGGGGGGKKELAQAGARDDESLRKALNGAKGIVKEFLSERGATG